jgi:hypothetical protein
LLCTRGCKATEAGRRQLRLWGFASSSVSKPLPLPGEASEHGQHDGSLRVHEKGEGSMKAKSLLLTVPLAVTALLSLSLPANAVCWSWKPCADYQGGYGYGAPPTESQSVLPPLPPGGAPPPGSQSGQQGATAAPAPAGAPENLKPKKPEATAKATPAAVSAKPKPKPAPAPAQAKAVPAPAPVPAQAKAVPPPAPAPQPAPVPAQAKAVPPPAPAPVPAQAKAQPAPAPQPAPVQAAKPAPAPAADPAGMSTVPGTATMQVIPE